LLRLLYINDTIMIEISQKQQKILELFLRNNLLSSSEVHDHLSKEGEETSLVTIKKRS
jgi:Fe2+ or Zn2+ uptake regulation protein